MLGQPATIVGANTDFVAPGHRKVILGTRHKDVILGTEGGDWIVSNGGADVIDGGGGDDYILGGSNPSDKKRDDPSKLIGGPGRDYIGGGFADDLIVGDRADLSRSVSGRVDRDLIDGEFGSDLIVGDNYSGLDAEGGSRDFIRAQHGGDTVIGDSAVTGAGTAEGGAKDHFESSSGNDLVVGDSYSPAGNAEGGGNDKASTGPGRDLVVGDSYTETGTATGGGDDEIHLLGGDDTGYGDNYAAGGGQAVGGGEDEIGGGPGEDWVFAGPAFDLCSGGPAPDHILDCEGELEGSGRSETSSACRLIAAVCASSSATPTAASGQSRFVVEPHLPRLAKEPAVTDLRHFLRSLRRRDHASRRAYRALLSRKHRFNSAARGVPAARDHRRKRFLKRYLAKKGRRHRGQIEKTSLAYYSYLRSLETHRVRQLVARISDEIDRLAYS